MLCSGLLPGAPNSASALTARYRSKCILFEISGESLSCYWCHACVSVLFAQILYADAGVSFLTDEADTVLAYENKGKSTEQAEQGGRDPLMSALNNLNRVQQLEIIHG